MRHLIQRTLNSFGFEVKRKIDAFQAQMEFINSIEPVIFDIGAYKGIVTKKYRSLLPKAKIYCFEPFPESFKRLQKAFANDNLVFCNEMAISNMSGTINFNSNASPATNSILETYKIHDLYWGKDIVETKNKLKVKASTIDNFCSKSSINSIDIVKIDVQGAEYEVLEGAKNMLTNRAIRLIYFELILVPTYVGQHLFYKYFELLNSYNYELIDFFNPIRKGNKLLQVDLLYYQI